MGGEYINSAVGNFLYFLIKSNSCTQPPTCELSGFVEIAVIRLARFSIRMLNPRFAGKLQRKPFCFVMSNIPVFFTCGLVIPVFNVFRRQTSAHDRRKTRQNIAHDGMLSTGRAFLFPALFLGSIATLHRKYYRQSLGILKIINRCEHNLLISFKTRQKF